MSKRTRHTDNSKRQQPVQQQRAQARAPAPGGTPGKPAPRQDQPREGSDGRGSEPR